MNVLSLVSFKIFPAHMGGQKGVALFYQYLCQRYHVVLAVSKDNQESKNVKVEKILYPNKKIYFNFFRLHQLKKLMQKNGSNIIIAEHSYTGWLAWQLKKRTGKPFIIHSHNIESKRFRQMHKWWWKLYHYYEGWIHRKAAHSFFISNEDLEFAVKAFRLSRSKCSVISYGVEKIQVKKNKSALRKELDIDENKTILLFNGTLDYKPNYDAVVAIIEKIDPLLRKRLTNYQIIITGNRAKKKLVEKILNNKNILYPGYVDDVNLYYQAADIFINPVANNTGVKTKLIEAIANHCTVVSVASGASGIRKDLCEEKLITVEDNNWNLFVDAIIQYLASEQSIHFTPESFFDFYSWNTIVRNASETIERVVTANG